jgi:serine/threonine protein phosphatase PrpC
MSGPVSSNATLFREANMEAVEKCAIGDGTAVAYSKVSPAKETPNEDAAALIPVNHQAAVLVVADGLGGVRAGERASTLAIESLEAELRGVEADGLMLRTAILNGIERANKAISDLEIGAATTLAVAEIEGGVVRSYHVGDSMILAVGQRGRVKLQTVSHSPVGLAVEAGFLDEAEAMHHEDRHIVSNVVGCPQMRIEVGPSVKLAPYDTLLLATDGLFDNLHVEEIIEYVRKGPLDRAGKNLASEARRRMAQPAEGEPSKPDDLTFVLFRRGRLTA